MARTAGEITAAAAPAAPRSSRRVSDRLGSGPGRDPGRRRRRSAATFSLASGMACHSVQIVQREVLRERHLLLSTSALVCSGYRCWGLANRRGCRGRVTRAEVGQLELTAHFTTYHGNTSEYHKKSDEKNLTWPPGRRSNVWIKEVDYAC